MQNASRKCSKKHTQDWQWNQKVSETQHPGQNSMIDVENPDARKKKFAVARHQGGVIYDPESAV